MLLWSFLELQHLRQSKAGMSGSCSSFRIPRSKRKSPSSHSAVTPGPILTDEPKKEKKRNPPFPPHHNVRYQSGVCLTGVWITVSVPADQSLLATDS